MRLARNFTPRPSVTPTRILPKGLGDLFLHQQGDVFHGLGVLEQRFAGRGQFVALGVLDEQCGAQGLLHRLDVPGHRGVGGVQPSRGGQQAAAALQLKKEAQVIPVEHGVSLPESKANAVRKRTAGG